MPQDSSLPRVDFRHGRRPGLVFCEATVQIGDERTVETFYGADGFVAAHDWAAELVRPVIGEVTATRLAARVADLWRAGFTKEAHAVDAAGKQVSPFADEACAWNYHGAVERACYEFMVDRGLDDNGPDVQFVNLLEGEFGRRYPEMVSGQSDEWGDWWLEDVIARPEITQKTMIELAEAVRDLPQAVPGDGMSPP